MNVYVFRRRPVDWHVRFKNEERLCKSKSNPVEDQ